MTKKPKQSTSELVALDYWFARHVWDIGAEEENELKDLIRNAVKKAKEQGKKELVEEVWGVYVKLMDESITDSQVLLNLETWLKSQIKKEGEKL